MRSEAARVRAARAELEAVWSQVFGLYRLRPATGALGAEVVGLALEAEELLVRDPGRARRKLAKARELLSDLGAPAA